MSKSPNLSPVSFDAWLTIIFDQRVSSSNGLAFRYDYRVSDEPRVVAHMTRLCREFGAVSKRFTSRQVDKGIWFLLGCDFGFGEYLANPGIELQARLDCVRAMVHPYSNFVAPSRVQMMENCFDMWWDLLCGSFWSANLQRIKRDELDAAAERDMKIEEKEELEMSPRARFYAESDFQGDIAEQLARFDLTWEDLETEHSKIRISYAELEPAQQSVADAMLETLTQILYLEDARCQQYALHGLNHLEHPRGAAIVQGFIDRHKSEWSAAGLAWVQSCRDATAM